jgi:heat shock protein HslJ
MRTSRSFPYLAGTLALVSFGCASSVSTTDVEGRTAGSPTGSWSLSAFDLTGGQTVLVPSPERYLLELGDDGKARVRADCNFCNGEYRSSGTSLSMGALACTRAACPPGSLDFDYLRALDSATAFESTREELSITYPEGVLRFTRSEDGSGKIGP